MKFLSYNMSRMKALLVMTLFISTCIYYNTYAQNELVFINGNHVFQRKLTNISSFPTSVCVLPQRMNIAKSFARNAKFYIVANLGDDYSSHNYTGGFSIEISFRLVALDDNDQEVAGVFKVNNKIILTPSQPEGSYMRDLSDYALPNTDYSKMNYFSFKSIKVQITNATGIPASLSSSLNVEARYEVDYGIDNGGNVLGTAIPVTAVTAIAKPFELLKSKKAHLTWDATYGTSPLEFPEYEIQLMRLYNTDRNKQTEFDITADIDWNKALRIRTESSSKSLDITIGEGQGFYAWRVRPIGSFYEGASADSRNFSENTWSNSFSSDAATVALRYNNNDGAVAPLLSVISGTAPVAGIFFFKDEDVNRNYIYSRMFSEQNKIRESISFANGLNMAKQQQTYLPSNTGKKLIATQSVADNTGRPAMNTLPLPIGDDADPDKDVLKYRNNLVTAEGTGKLYTAKEYDAATNYKNPSKVSTGDASNPMPSSYYSDLNPDTDVPSAEGYPYSRTLYYNDPTGRVKEQSGVGKTHMTGTAADQGKVVKTAYGTASESELIKLFGKEAPNNEAVFKTVTTDQNGTSSIIYTDKTGKTIATSLAFNEGDNGTFESLYGGADADVASQDVTDLVRKNTSDPRGIVSSKRIVLTESTDLSLSYTHGLKSADIPCLNATNSCKYSLQLWIKQVDGATALFPTPVMTIDDASTCTSAVPCSYTAAQVPAGTYIVEKILIPKSQTATSTTGSTLSQDPLLQFTTLITDHLKAIKCPEDVNNYYAWLRTMAYHLSLTKNSDGTPNASTSNFTNLYNIDPTTITYLQLEYNNGIENIATLTQGLPACKSDAVGCTAIAGAWYKPANDRFDAYQQVLPVWNMYIKSGCCNRMKVLVKYIPPFKAPTSAQLQTMSDEYVASEDKYKRAGNYYKINTQQTETPAQGAAPSTVYYYPDFEGYAISVLSNYTEDIASSQISSVNVTATDFTDLNANKTKAAQYFYSQMMGWNPGDINIMVHKMLTDKYSCQNPKEVLGDGVAQTGNPVFTPSSDPCTGQIADASTCVPCLTAASNDAAICNTYADGRMKSMTLCQQYSSEQLISCWTAIVNTMVNQLANGVAKKEDAPVDDSPVNDPQLENGPQTQSKSHKQSSNYDTKDKDKSDDQFNIGFKIFPGIDWFIKWVFKKIISAKMRDKDSGQQGDIAQFFDKQSRVKDFLNCTGYRFAKILSPSDPLPLPGDASYTIGTTSGPLGNYNSWPAIATNDISHGEASIPVSEVYPLIKHPHYAFKYFYYAEDDKDYENTVCYNDPNDCYIVKTDPSDPTKKTKVKVPCCLSSSFYNTNVYPPAVNQQAYMSTDPAFRFCKVIDKIGDVQLTNTSNNVEVNSIANVSFPFDDNTLTVSTNEIITNGDFSSGSNGWIGFFRDTPQESFIIENGKAKLFNTTTAGNVALSSFSTATAPFIVGNVYRLQHEISNFQLINVAVYATATNNFTTSSTSPPRQMIENNRMNGQFSTVFTAKWPYLTFYPEVTNGAPVPYAYLDNVSVKQVINLPCYNVTIDGVLQLSNCVKHTPYWVESTEYYGNTSIAIAEALNALNSQDYIFSAILDLSVVGISVKGKPGKGSNLNGKVISIIEVSGQQPVIKASATMSGGKDGQISFGSFQFNYNDPSKAMPAGFTCNTKLAVRNFTGAGERLCNMTRLDWNCGQRYTFYESVKNKTASSPVDLSDKLAANAAEGELHGKADYLVQLADYNPSGTTAAQTLGLQAEEKSNWKNWFSLTDVVVNDPSKYPSRMEYTLVKMQKDCEQGCDKKKDLFRQRLTEKFQNAGYVIGGCADPAGKAIDDTDIDAMVQIFVSQCKPLCKISSFSANASESRWLDSPLEYFYTSGGGADNTKTVAGAYPALSSRSYSSTELATIQPGVNGPTITAFRYGQGTPDCNVAPAGTSNTQISHAYASQVVAWPRRSSVQDIDGDQAADQLYDYSAFYDYFNAVLEQEGKKIRNCELKKSNIIATFEDFDIAPVNDFDPADPDGDNHKDVYSLDCSPSDMSVYYGGEMQDRASFPVDGSNPNGKPLSSGVQSILYCNDPADPECPAP